MTIQKENKLEPPPEGQGVPHQKGNLISLPGEKPLRYCMNVFMYSCPFETFG